MLHVFSDKIDATLMITQPQKLQQHHTSILRRFDRKVIEIWIELELEVRLEVK